MNGIKNEGLFNNNKPNSPIDEFIGSDDKDYEKAVEQLKK
jgi:hypothetical protein